MPIGKVTVDRNLEGAEHANIDMPAPHHGETIGMMKERTPRHQGDGLFPSVYKVPVLFPASRGRSHSQQAVLALQDNFAVDGQVIRDLRRQSDTEVDIRP